MNSGELKIPLLLPAKIVHQGPNQEGPDKAPEGEHGDRHRPQQGQSEGVDELSSSVAVGVVVELLHELANKERGTAKTHPTRSAQRTRDAVRPPEGHPDCSITRQGTGAGTQPHQPAARWPGALLGRPPGGEPPRTARRHLWGGCCPRPAPPHAARPHETRASRARPTWTPGHPLTRGLCRGSCGPSPSLPQGPRVSSPEATAGLQALCPLSPGSHL